MKNAAFTIPRSEPRIHINLPVRLRFGWKWSEEITAEATEISAQGMRVRWNSPLRYYSAAILEYGDERGRP